MTKRYLCVHGHFYQPPRENPWLEAIEPQDSAAPFSDWNARINSECYGPNGVSRIRGAGGRVIRVANNYEQLSFNFGPTLLSWMADFAPDTLATIVEGDRKSTARLGHGNAMAQAYNHMIMPLATPRDRRTQIRWGIADFRARFGREPEGMWLPETAVDTDTLEALAAAGLRFTVLAPGQARRWRPVGDASWQDAAGGAIDPRRAYRAALPSGRELALFFYDGGLAHGVAFGGLLDSGDRFSSALLGAFDDQRDEPQLVHMATDGESYGHHHRFGDMALAYAFDQLARQRDVEVVNYATFLARHPPTWEVEINEASSWSCAHGVERWRSHCGCNVGTPGFHQRWRAPLREALDLLKAALDELFEQEGPHWLRDPWAARDDYVRVVLTRSPEVVDELLARHLKGTSTEETRLNALRLLEQQRNAMLMFTSCGWFFDELSGLEGTQILKYAARALQLAAPFRDNLEAPFLEVLGRAESNIARHRDGLGIWRQLIEPARVTLERVVAHAATGAVLADAPAAEEVYAYHVASCEQSVDELGDTHLGLGRLEVTSRVTGETCGATYAVLHFGGLDLHAWVRAGFPVERYREITEEARRLFREASIGDVYDALRGAFEVDSFKLQDLFARERRRLAEGLIDERLAAYRGMLSSLATPDRPMVERLRRLGIPLPPVVQLAADIHLEQEVLEELDDLDDAALDRLRELGERGHQLEGARARDVARGLEQRLEAAIVDAPRAADSAPLELALRLLEAARALELEPNLWTAQNALLTVAKAPAEGALAERELLGRLAERLGLDRALLRPGS